MPTLAQFQKLFSCSSLLLLMAMTIAGTDVWAEGNEGKGGTGDAYTFKALGYRLHRELLMQPYDANNMQVRDEMPLDAFLYALEGTAASATDEPIYDDHGDEQTVLYFTPEQVRAKYMANTSKNYTPEQIKQLMKDRPYGEYLINRKRFADELKDMPTVLQTVMHEVRRAMGYNETNYQSSASQYGREFFERLAATSSPVSQETFQKAAVDVPLINDRLALIDAEKIRKRKEIDEDYAPLLALTEQQRPYVDSLRASASRTFNAYAYLFEHIGMIHIGPSSLGPMMRGMGKVVNAQLDQQQKMSELEVLTLKVNFLKNNYRRNTEFFDRISRRGHDLFCEKVGGCPEAHQQ